MNETNVNWDDLQLFLAVAREGGLSPAAKVTARSPATLGRRMHILERALGKELFVRHERGYELTDGARQFFDELTDVEMRIVRIAAPTTKSQTPLIKISAGSWTTLFLMNKIDGLSGQPQDVRLRFIAAEDILDISRREAVIGFRNARPTEGSLAGRKVARVDFAPYGARKAPETWIRVTANTPSAKWVAKMVADTAPYEVNSPRNALDLALLGKGMAVLPTFIGDAQKALHRVGAIIPELSHDQWIVTHQDDRNLPEVRRVLDRLYRFF